MKGWSAAALALGILLAGCAENGAAPRSSVADLPSSLLDQADGTPAPAPPAGPDAMGAPPAELAPGLALRWTGTCPCPTYRFRVADAPADWLEVRVRWDGTAVPDLGLAVLDAAGGVHEGVRGFDARRVQVWAPSPGDVLVSVLGNGSFEAEATLRYRAPQDAGARLPDLTTTIPSDVHIGGCDPWEASEQGATRCLRLGNGVSNPGHGPLQVFLTVPEAAGSFAGLGHFIQQVLQADGSWDSHRVGAAELHVAHGHWHYDGLAGFALYAVQDGLRGEQVAAHGKAGFCFLDWDRMPENETEPGQGGYAESNCIIPADANGWSNGISAGYYDFYGAYLSDQYVDVAGVPDGTYELVSIADPAGGMLEADTTNNAASVLLTLRGNTVTVLEPRGWYQLQADDRVD